MSTPLGPAGAARVLLAALESGRPAVLLVRADDGARLVVEGEGRVHGSLGDGALDRAAAGLAVEVAAGRAQEGLHAVGEPDRPVEVYAEAHHPTPELLVVGAGHIARPLVEVGALLGFRVRVLDDRPDFATRERFPGAEDVRRVDFADPFAGLTVGAHSHVVLVTRGHKYDFECLRRLLAADPPPRYVGMIGSRRRVRATFERLLDEGVPRERIAVVRAPVGLDLGAETPAEIAVAVAAEIVLLWRGGSGAPLRDAERVLERLLPEGGARPDGPDEREPGPAGTSRADDGAGEAEP